MFIRHWASYPIKLSTKNEIKSIEHKPTKIDFEGLNNWIFTKIYNGKHITGIQRTTAEQIFYEDNLWKSRPS